MNRRARTLRRMAVGSSICLSLLSCRESPPEEVVTADEPGIIAPSLWQAPATGRGQMFLIFEPGGSARFEEGFEFFNPAGWSFDEGTGELRLSVSGVTPEIESVLVHAAERDPHASYESPTRTLVYRSGEDLDSLWIGGQYFYRRGR